MALRILILRFSSIGDIVLTTPVMRCIKNVHPDAHITYVTKKGFAAMLEVNPYIDKVIALDNNWTEIKTSLQTEAFDHIIDLHHNLRSKRLCRGLQGQYKAFNKLNIQKWLLVNFKINRLPSIHIVDRYMEAASNLSISNDGKGLDYFIPSSTEVPLLPNTPFVALAIGGQHATKRLPDNKLAELIQQIEHPVVLLGGKEEMDTAVMLSEQFPNQVAFNYCGAISLNQSALVLTKSCGLLTHDTGMMHIAAALSIPILSVWGNTVPEFGMWPYFKAEPLSYAAPLIEDGKADETFGKPGVTAESRSEMFEVAGLSCRPCSKIGHKECPKGHFNCMILQDTTAMADRLNQLASSAEEK